MKLKISKKITAFILCITVILFSCDTNFYIGYSDYPEAAPSTATTPSPKPASPIFPIIYEAEAVENVIVAPDPEILMDGIHSDNFFVRNIGEGENNYIQFNNLNVPAEGIYRCTVNYKSSLDRNVFIAVNGASGHLSNFVNSNGTLTGLNINIKFNRGINTIKLYSDLYLPALDNLVINKAEKYPLKYEAESILNSFLHKSKQIVNDTNCSGNQFVIRPDSESNNFLKFNYISVDKSGVYTCRFRFRSYIDGGRCHIRINNSTGYSIEFFSDGIFDMKDIQIYLTEGANTIHLYNDFNSFIPDLDYIEIKPYIPEAVTFPARYEAEAYINTISDPDAWFSYSKDFSGNYTLGNIGEGKNNYVQLNYVTADIPGEYNCKIYYKAWKDFEGFISINGSKAIQYEFPQTVINIEYIEVPINLMPGNNTIRFYSDANLPELDCIVIEEIKNK